MNKNILFFLFLLIPLSLRSQENLCIGKKYTIHSSYLNETREYFVSLPQHYDQNKQQTYPVIYLLDGDKFFSSLVGMTQILTTERGKKLPPHIIVGIVSTDRTKDFTPTCSAAERDGKIALNAIPKGGESETFYRFLTKELRNVINKTFRTNEDNVLMGHSYCGLFTLNTFLKHSESFKTYIAEDPSIWWDRAELSHKAQKMISGKDFTGKTLYIGFATKKRPDRVNIYQDETNHLLSEVLPKAKGLNLYSKLFSDQTHGTIAIPGFFDALIQIYCK